MPIFRSGILDAYLKGTALRQQREGKDKELALRQQQLQEEQRQFQEMLRLKQEQFKAQQQTDAANFGLRQQEAKLHIANALAGGVLAPTKTDGDTAIYEDKSLGQIQAPSAEGLAKRKATMLAPEIQAGIDKAVKTYTALSPLKEADADKASTRKISEAKAIDAAKTQNEEKLLDKKLAGEEKLARIRQDGAMRIAQMHEAGANARLDKKMAADSGRDTASLENVFDGLISGQSTLEDLGKMGYAPKERAAMNTFLAKKGIVPLNDQTKKDFKALALLSSLYTEAADLTEKINRSGPIDKLTSAVGFDTEIKTTQERLRARATSLARELSGERGAVTEGDARRAELFIAKIGFGPNAKANNIRTLDSLRKALAVRQKAITGKMSDEQKTKVFQTFGIPDYSQTQIPGEFE